MDKRILLIVISLISCFFSMALYAQEKTQPYYNSHETEILPDAKKAFQAGKYERAEELCRWHYIIVGDRSADSLRDMARRCLRLSDEMKDYLMNGDLKAAKESATALLALNPDDVAAKGVLATEETPVVDTLINRSETVQEELGEQEKPEEEIIEEVEVVQPEAEEPVPTIEPKPQITIENTKVAIKANFSVLDLSQFAQTIAPGAGVAVYDLAGSRFGAEVGAYVCQHKASDFNGSVFGADVSLLFRATKGIYPKVSVGAFNYKSKTGSFNPTNVMRIGAGVSIIIARHLCLDAGVSFFPEVKINGTKKVNTSNLEYDFPDVLSVLSAGVSPMIGFGWAF